MNRHIHRLALLLIGFSLLNSGAAWAQFHSGSTGSDGAINVTSGTTTLDLSEYTDSIVNATTVNVAAGATLNFIPDALNRPVYLLATGDITVNGTISVIGQGGTTTSGGLGGPGGFRGGAPGLAGAHGGDGFGPGRGSYGTSTTNAGAGAYSSRGNCQNFSLGVGAVYGSPLLVPLVGGSGGGGAPGRGGSGGGGAILLSSDTAVRITGSVLAYGGVAIGNGIGSGGAIRIVSPVVAGSGGLNAGGNQYNCSSGNGRVRVDLIDRTQLQLIVTGAYTVGSFMAVFPDVTPKLDIVRVAGRDITLGESAPPPILLPFNSPTTQSISVRAIGFGGTPPALVPVRIELTPDSADATTGISSTCYDTTIDTSVACTLPGIPGSCKTIDAVFPLNVATRVKAWSISASDGAHNPACVVVP